MSSRKGGQRQQRQGGCFDQRQMHRGPGISNDYHRPDRRTVFDRNKRPPKPSGGDASTSGRPAQADANAAANNAALQLSTQIPQNLPLTTWSLMLLMGVTNWSPAAVEPAEAAPVSDCLQSPGRTGSQSEG